MANKKTTVKQLLQTLAKERGLEVSDPSSLDDKKVKGGGVTSKLERGAGFGEAFTETAKEKYQAAKEAVTTTKGVKSLGKKVYMEMFKGQDIFSAYMRGRLKGGDEKPSMKGSGGAGDLGGDASQYLTIIAKESMAIPGMARDTNVMRQNLQQLVKIWGGKAATKRESVEERGKDTSFFAEQDKKEAEQEASRVKKETGTAPTPATGGGGEGGGSLIDTIISLFSNGFMNAAKTLFNPKVLLKFLSKAGPIAIIGTAIYSVFQGYKTLFEGGSFKDAFVKTWGTFLDILTFGLFGEDEIKFLFDKVSEFFDPVVKTIQSIFGGIKDFFVKLFGGDVDIKDEKIPEAGKMPTSEPPKAPGGAGGAGGAGPPAAAPTALAPAAPAAPSPTPTAPAPAPTAPSKVPPPSERAVEPRKQSAESRKLQEQQQAEANADALEASQGELQGLYADWRAEKGAAMEKLVNSGANFSDDPKAPNYPKELKEIDDKYNKWIGIKKSEIENLKKKPGVQEALKRRNAEDKRFDDLEKEAKTPTKVGGMKYATTEKVETTGGGETTTKIKLTPEAQKAKEELKALEEKQSAERKEAVAKAKAEGKIKGRFATSTDFEEVGELKALKTKQEAEREALLKKISEGTSVETTKSGGAGGGGAVSAGGGGAPSAGAASTGGAAGGGAPSGGAPAAGEISPAGAAGASAASVSPTPSEPSAAGGTTAPMSGAQLSSSSTEVAEQQRMESAADQGTVVNAPTNNSSSGSTGKAPKKTADVYDSDLSSRLATT